MHGNPLNNLRTVFEQFLIALQSGQRLPYNLLTKQTASVEIYLLICDLSAEFKYCLVTYFALHGVENAPRLATAKKS